MICVFVREEEQKYLTFISDVTTDILARGIFSNRYVMNIDGFLPAVFKILPKKYSQAF